MRFDAIEMFAIHPGGRRILEACEEELGLTKEHNCFAYEVLANYGNMSSPTVVFVLNNMLKTLGSQDNGKHLLSFAFGPGLTMESMLLRVAAN
jgi:predicted naringenin-chalcone synthase